MSPQSGIISTKPHFGLLLSRKGDQSMEILRGFAWMPPYSSTLPIPDRWPGRVKAQSLSTRFREPQPPRPRFPRSGNRNILYLIMPDDSFEAREYVAAGKQEAIVLLGRAVSSLEEEIEDHEQDAVPLAASEPALQPRDLTKVFVVHGHDEGTREAVARFLERLEIRPIILHEQANQGRTVIEKVEVHGNVGFAVVLLTPDDEGSVKGGTPAPRARQNVVLELGYFIGRLARKYVCALKRGEVEIPSDFGGVLYETFDSGGGWKQALGRELHEAGYHIDWNIVMRS
jgi:predicted nucleotide-binding protein